MCGFISRRQDKRCLRLIEFTGNPLHHYIVEHLGVGNHREWVAGQRPFGENINKIKLDLHWVLCCLARWLISSRKNMCAAS
jgi:hypothetical protein